LNKDRNWDILLIGGASGTGKTKIARQLATLYNIDLVRVDDFQVLLEALTTPETFPTLHYWSQNHRWKNEGVQNAVQRLINVGQALSPGLSAVVKDHVEENIPMIMEGDFILPEFVASVASERVKSVFIHEPSKEQIMQNFLAREGDEQEFRAEISHSFGRWLADECSKHSIATFEARPWESLLDRVAGYVQK